MIIPSAYSNNRPANSAVRRVISQLGRISWYQSMDLAREFQVESLADWYAQRASRLMEYRATIDHLAASTINIRMSAIPSQHVYVFAAVRIAVTSGLGITPRLPCLIRQARREQLR